MAGPGTTRQWRDFEQAYHCSRIGRMVDITTRVIALPQQAESQHPIHCSGFAGCRLFPLRFFPEVTHLRAPTGTRMGLGQQRGGLVIQRIGRLGLPLDGTRRQLGP